MPARGLREILSSFLRLGLTSFGGPIAHLAFFRREFVERRQWLGDAEFARLLALAQFLPGPASSQLGFAIGLRRGGWRGALLAFAAFTAPSALLLFGLAMIGAAIPLPATLVHGLKLVAVVVVAHGVWVMARRLTPDLPRIGIAVLTVMLTLTAPTAWMQLAAVALGATLGLLLGAAGPMRPRGEMPPAAQQVATPEPATAARHGSMSSASSLLAAAAFAAGLGLALAWPADRPSLGALAAAMWRAGSLVFGGGHVVLPLLEESLVRPGWLDAPQFLAGYGAAQAIPGPMFSFATYLGALVPTGLPAWIGAGTATLAIFAPGFLLVAAALPAWDRLADAPRATAAIAGVNAAVVGLLASALATPIIPAAIDGAADIAVALVALGLQVRLKRPTLPVIACCLVGAWLTSLL